MYVCEESHKTLLWRGIGYFMEQHTCKVNLFEPLLLFNQRLCWSYFIISTIFLTGCTAVHLAAAHGNSYCLQSILRHGVVSGHCLSIHYNQIIID